MQDFMRKHRKLILVLILIFIGIPFVFFFGMPKAQKSAEAVDTPVMQVGGIPITESQFRRALDATAQQMAPRGGQRPTYEEMDAAGQVKDVVEQLLDSTLITLEDQRRGFNVGRDFLEKQLRDLPMFKDEQGRFNPEAYNEFVSTPRNWDAIYQEMREDASRAAYLSVMLAPARRVLDAKIDEELAADYTKLRIKYAKIELPVTPTEEEIQKQYSENQETYRKPADNRADYVAISLAPPVPEKAVEAVTRARAGEDFAALFKEYSTLSVPEGGDMGWRKVEENATEHMAPLYALPVGGVSDPVFGPTGYFIYKVDEERTADDGAREIHFRQIVMEAKLSEEEMQQRKDLAAAIAARAKESDLATAASENSLTVAQTPVFTASSTEIAGIPRFDVPVFRSQVPGQKDDTLYTPVQGRSYIYVAKVTETVEGVVPPLDEIRERVTNDTITALREREDNQAKLEELCKRIAAEVSAMDQLPAKFPELNVEVKVTEKPFTRKDMLWQYQIYISASDIYEKLGNAEPGKVAGPISGMLKDTWFVELVEKTPPTEEDKAKWPEERKQKKEQEIRAMAAEFAADFTKDLRERMLAQVNFTQDQDAMDRILGRGKYSPEKEEAEKPAEDAAAPTPAADAPAPATDGPAPATEAPAPAAEAPAAGTAAPATETPAPEAEAPAPAQ